MDFEKIFPFLCFFLAILIVLMFLPIKNSQTSAIPVTGLVSANENNYSKQNVAVLPNFANSDENIAVFSELNSVPAVLNVPENPENLVDFGYFSYSKQKNGFFGVGTYFGKRFSSENFIESEMVFVDSKAQWAREEFSWDKIEKAEGVFDWSGVDSSVLFLSKHNVKVLGLIDYGNKWANSNSEVMALPNLEKFERYVKAVAERYDGDGIDDCIGSPVISNWEIWNEENSERFWKPNPNSEEYAKLLEVASKAVKEVNPSSLVVFGGTMGVDGVFIKNVLEKLPANTVDAVAVHPYSLFSSPESASLKEKLLGLESLNLPIWLTELGWPSSDNGGVLSEELQANYLSRSFIISYSIPFVEKVFWYDFRNDGENYALFEENFGLVKSDFSEKKAFNSFKELSVLLNDSSFLGKIVFVNEMDLQAFAFENPQGEKILFLWQLEPNSSSKEIVLNISNFDFSKAEILDLVNGTKKDLLFEKKDKFSKLNVSVSGNPKVLVLQE